MMPGPGALALLVLTAFVGGTVDAIAGGGGLLTVPALIAAGLPPHVALATNKGQSTFGSGAALLRFARSGMVDLGRARVAFPAAFLGSLLGAQLVLLVRPALLRPVILVLLLGVAAFMAFRRAPSASRPIASGRAVPAVVGAIAFVLGAYDGFFGPGTGTFLILAFVALLGDGVARASGEAKLVNFASNLAALVLFASRGVVAWRVAVPMVAAQLLGGTLGAHLVVRRGDLFVRRVVVLVAVALVLKLGRDLVVGS